MDGLSILCWVFLAVWVIGSAIIIIPHALDSYKGVRPFSRFVRDRMDDRWLHSRCLPGAGRACPSCRKRGECYAQCAKELMQEIDSEREAK